MKIVLDTNVLVSGLLTPFGPSAKVVRMLFHGELELYLDARILSEYREVLQRPKFNFSHDNVNVIIDFIEQHSQFISSLPLINNLPDTEDEPFLEVAAAGNAKALVTGNKKHFPYSASGGINIFSPSEFLEFHKKLRT
jgi:putative PIN family toxin of toxin-antitoxin system